MKFLTYSLAFTSIFLISSFAPAQTIVPPGPVSGTWTAAGSPYLVQGSISVTTGNTLIIEPAVEVEFQGYYSLTVNGYLDAMGTEADSIHFFPADTSTGWGGIRFMDAPDSSHLAYCTVRHSGRFNPAFGDGAIYCSNSNPVIAHCTISNNLSIETYYGGGISIVNGSGAVIMYCTISENFSPNGGIFVQGNSTHAILTGCNISNNNGFWGGGICLYESGNSTLTDCIISNNTCPLYGGGIYGYYSSATLTNCVISDHTVDENGGGLFCWHFEATLNNCTFRNNSATGDNSYGGGIACYYPGSNLTLSYCTFDSNRVYVYGKGGAIGMIDGYTNEITVDHCTFYKNRTSTQQSEAIYIGAPNHAEVHNSIFAENGFRGAIGVQTGATLSAVTYTDFYGNNNNIIGTAPANFGIITTTNYNGDPCDQYYNIFEQDPLFSDPAAGDFQITWANFPDPDSTRSPCIDAGDPVFAMDPDSTVTDMGAYFFHQGIPNIELSTNYLPFPNTVVGEQSELPFTISNVGNGNLIIYDIIYSGSPAFTTNWNYADSLILPGGSLEIMVTFAPDDDTLFQKLAVILYNGEEWAPCLFEGWGIAPDIELSTDTLDFDSVLVGEVSDLPLVIYNIGSSDLILHDLAFGLSVFTTNWDPADSLILAGDSLEVTVAFTPAEIATYYDTLRIDNNDELALVFLQGEGIGGIEVILTPYGTPITIPANGGTFDFNIAFANYDTASIEFDIWTMATLPDSSVYGPIILFPRFTAPANWSGDRDRTQNVPGAAPIGLYTYDAYIGEYPDSVYSEDHFNFEKLAASDGGPIIYNWDNWGEDFAELMGETAAVIPEVYTLEQNYPNPFNPYTTIRFGLPEAGHVSMNVFNILGQRVINLIDGYRNAGYYEVNFDASMLSSGLYFYRIEADDFVKVKKMVLLK